MDNLLWWIPPLIHLTACDASYSLLRVKFRYEHCDAACIRTGLFRALLARWNDQLLAFSMQSLRARALAESKFCWVIQEVWRMKFRTAPSTHWTTGFVNTSFGLAEMFFCNWFSILFTSRSGMQPWALVTATTKASSRMNEAEYFMIWVRLTSYNECRLLWLNMVSPSSPFAFIDKTQTWAKNIKIEENAAMT